MRLALAIVVTLLLSAAMQTVGGPVQHVASFASISTVVAAQQAQPEQPGKINVDVNVNRTGGVWWRSPVWIAIGVIGVVLLVVVIALIARGGGTTIVRE